jgi:HSP20 family molecular chaperone IbpA
MGNRWLTGARAALCSASMARRYSHSEADPTDDLVDRLLGFAPRYGLQHSWRPSIDVFRDPAGITVIAELPGVEEGEVQVTVEANRLRVAGTRRPPRLEAADPLRLEIDYGPFERVVVLPADSDGDAITAHLRQGLLTVHVPRRAARPIVVREVPDGGSTNE